MRVHRHPVRIPNMLYKAAIIMKTRLEVWFMGVFLKNISN